MRVRGKKCARTVATSHANLIFLPYFILFFPLHNIYFPKWKRNETNEREKKLYFFGRFSLFFQYVSDDGGYLERANTCWYTPAAKTELYSHEKCLESSGRRRQRKAPKLLAFRTTAPLLGFCRRHHPERLNGHGTRRQKPIQSSPPQTLRS